MKRPAPLATLSALALIASAGLLVAGPLTPPAGPVASSYKTLSEVEPRIALSAANTPGDATYVYKITQPGSYYLTGNIQISNKSAVFINTSGVTLDLNGFEIVDAAPLSGAARNGIHVYAGTRNVCIRNGTVRDINGDGVYDQGSGARYERLSLNGCHGHGLYAGMGSVINDCTANGCGDAGFRSWQATITGCTSIGNTGKGFWFSSGCVVDRCTAQSNVSSGFDVSGGVVTRCSSFQNLYGFDAYGAQVIECDASSNNSGQIRTALGCVVRNCDVQGVSGFAGILVGTDCRIEGNRTSLGTVGIQTTAGGGFNVIVGNTIFTPSNPSGILTAGSDCVGPVVSSGGLIATNSPFANFVR